MSIHQRVEQALGEPIRTSSPVSGGCIANSFLIETESGQQLFLKSLADQGSMFLLEANGLRELAKANAIRVPEVIHAEADFLILEVIESGHQDHR